MKKEDLVGKFIKIHNDNKNCLIKVINVENWEVDSIYYLIEAVILKDYRTNTNKGIRTTFILLNTPIDWKVVKEEDVYAELI